MIVALLLASIAVAQCQVVPLWIREPQFYYQNEESANIRMEVFLDPVSPVSNATWTVMKQLAANYGRGTMSLKYFVHPVSYRRSSFPAVQAFFVVNSLSPANSLAFLETVMSRADEFTDEAANKYTTEQITKKFSLIFQEVTGLPAFYFDAYFERFRGTAMAQWKYAVRRGVADGPWFFLNGVDMIKPADKVVGFAEWTRLLNQFVRSYEGSNFALNDEGNFTTAVPPKTTTEPMTKSTASNVKTTKEQPTFTNATTVGPSTTQTPRPTPAPVNTRPQVLRVPRQLPGYVYSGDSDAQYHIEMYVEPLCPGSSSQYKILKQLVQMYGPKKLRYTLLPFPLIFHTNGFVTVQGYMQVLDKAPENITKYMDIMYDEGIILLSNGIAEQFTRAETIEHLAEIQAEATGISEESFVANFEKYFQDAKDAWQQAGRRGVASTPWYFVNGVEINTESDITYRMSLSDWERTIAEWDAANKN
ncbi:unnamed protein product [Owenia fusiformis]|uniref:Thioredoxin-like fold domain-containing protein n=1 Tax=Owenia fusiformis TaxID=6347 RepID=A0A8J1TRS8_OWEFU|nr:unnamed protein product [Owenia fusiformis]